jgi:hypothetical protein
MSSPKCLRCNRPLTDPKSIKRGFGSGCWRMIKKIRRNRVPENIVEYDPNQFFLPGLTDLFCS